MKYDEKYNKILYIFSSYIELYDENMKNMKIIIKYIMRSGKSYKQY